MPERLLREPWRLALFFVAVFGALIICLGTILWQENTANTRRAIIDEEVRRTQNLVLVGIQKSDRNNDSIRANIEATRKAYEAGRKTRARLVALVDEEKRLNLAILRMQGDNERMNREQLEMGREIVRLLRRRH